MASKGWIGVDLDGTLAHYEYGAPDWSPVKIGAPVPAMLERVKRWLLQGHEVRIFTARVGEDNLRNVIAVKAAIMAWCIEHIGQPLQVTNIKDYHMIELWDDRAVQVEVNTGRVIGNSTRGLE